MTTFVRWKHVAPPPAYQYFEVTKGRWVDCPREMLAFFLKNGSIHMNPKFDPIHYLVPR